MVMQLAPNNFFFLVSFGSLSFAAWMPLWWCMPPQNIVGRRLKATFWRIFLLCHSEIGWTWNTRESMSLACFPLLFFGSFAVHLILWCCRTVHFQHPIEFHNHHLLVSRARATIWCRQTCWKRKQSTTVFCSAAVRFFSSVYFFFLYKRIEYLPRFCFVFAYLDIVRCLNRVLICKCLLGEEWVKEHITQQRSKQTNLFNDSPLESFSNFAWICVCVCLRQFIYRLKSLIRATECNTKLKLWRWILFYLPSPLSTACWMLSLRRNHRCDGRVRENIDAIKSVQNKFSQFVIFGDFSNEHRDFESNIVTVGFSFSIRCLFQMTTCIGHAN